MLRATNWDEALTRFGALPLEKKLLAECDEWPGSGDLAKEGDCWCCSQIERTAREAGRIDGYEVWSCFALEPEMARDINWRVAWATSEIRRVAIAVEVGAHWLDRLRDAYWAGFEGYLTEMFRRGAAAFDEVEP